MSKNLNQDLYSRFGLKLDVRQVQDGCKKYLKSEIVDALGPIVRPGSYKDSAKLWDLQSAVLDELCRQLFFDIDDWYGTDYSSGLKRLIDAQISDNFKGSFEEYAYRLQVLLNVVYSHGSILFELNKLSQRIDKYLSDFPVLGITIKIYKSKAPQILPTTSKKFEEEIKNTLGLLEADKKYEHVLSHFESGLKEFLTAKTQAHYKDVIEDMYTSCDELVKSVSSKQGKGFKHISDKDDARNLKLNGHQKELFKNLRNWMDEIKHGSLKEFDRNDVEMIVSMVGSLIRSTIVKQQLINV